VAIIDVVAYQKAWMALIESTKAFTDLSRFRTRRDRRDVPEIVREMLIKRGLMHLEDMPACEKFDKDRTFLDTLSKQYNSMFSSVTVSFYMNEYAFCWKQNSAIQEMLRR